jgi:hypothetical protein
LAGDAGGSWMRVLCSSSPRGIEVTHKIAIKGPTELFRSPA